MTTQNKTANTTSDTNEVVLMGIMSIMENQTDSWQGTITNLTSALNKVLSRHQRAVLPGSPSALRLVINRIVNRLRNRGVGVTFSRATDRKRTRFVRFNV